jgi:hypothetical protein
LGSKEVISLNKENELLLKQIIDDEIKAGNTFKNLCFTIRDYWVEITESKKIEKQLAEKKRLEEERNWLLKGL